MRRVVLVLLLCVCGLTAQASFTYYSPITVNTGQVPSTQTNFPILVSQTDTRFKTVGNGGHVQNASGFDIRPYSNSALTTALTYELERYNATTGEVVMWVKIASLADGNVTYLAYGDTSISTDGSDGTNTFSNSFLGVYHMKDGTTLNVNSSTGSNNGTNTGCTAAAGQIDGAAGNFLGTTQHIALSNTMNPNAITLSGWVNASAFSNAYNTPFGRNDNANFWILYIKSTGKLGCFVKATTSINYDGTGSHTLSTGTWYFLAMTYDSSAGLVGYVNASSDGTVAANGAVTTNTVQADIGRDPVSSGQNYFKGTMDEVRVSSVARSANWITTEYNNQSAPGTFEALGIELPTQMSGNFFWQ